MKHKIKHYMAALLLTSMVWSGHAQEKNEMDLSGEWAFQTDVMDFRRGSLDVRYCHRAAHLLHQIPHQRSPW